jgi:hypothetical protein
MKELFCDLISGRGFERLAGRYFSDLDSTDVDVAFSYSDPEEEHPSLRVDFHNGNYVSRITLWETRWCEVEVVSFTDSNKTTKEASEIDSIDVFEEKLSGVIDFMKNN